jgi:hypothetical protein
VYSLRLVPVCGGVCGEEGEMCGGHVCEQGAVTAAAAATLLPTHHTALLQHLAPDVVDELHLLVERELLFSLDALEVKAVLLLQAIAVFADGWLM